MTQNGSISQVKNTTFNNDVVDMDSALHSAAVKNVYLDKAGNIHTSNEDFWNFNSKRWSAKGIAGWRCLDKLYSFFHDKKKFIGQKTISKEM